MEYLLKSSAIIMLFYICYKLFLQRETFFKSNRWFLLIGLSSAFFIPLIIIPIYTTIDTTQFNAIVATSDTTTEAITNHYSIFDVLFLAYMVGAIVFLVKFILQLYSLGRLFISNKAQKIGRYNYIKTHSDISPFSFFNWIVYNPEQFKNDELYQIITHEKAHVNQLHSIDIILTHFACIVFWFNPIIWLYKKDLQLNLEYLADQSAQNNVDCSKTYQHLLLKTSMPNYNLALTNNFYNSLIKNRIVMLHKNRSKNSKQWKMLLVLPLIAIFLMSFNTKEVYTNQQVTTENTNHEEDVEMVIITKDMSDADLDRLQKKLSKKGVSLKFKGVKRNTKNEITAIKIDASVKKANSNYSASSDESIKPIKISFTDHSISLGSAEELHFKEGYSFSSKDGKHKIHTSNSGKNVFVFSEAHVNHDDSYEVIEEDDKIIIKSGETLHEIKKSDEHKNAFFVSKNGTKVVEFKKGKHDENDVIILKEDKNGNIVSEWIADKDKNVWIKDNDEAIYITTKNSDKEMVYISSNENDNPLIIVDGKEVSKKEFDKIKSDQIEKVEVLKGENATKKYGKKAKDGVIIVTTKK